ncbi:heterokaryon incompatibility protein-domain-containing protein [Daldinia grandis]|nr:heterokaryon incompatibility protein-domain-containing protein [Daldinia grandis]
MRLLNTHTLKVVEFTQERPRYAILSHMWEYDEVLFQDIKHGFASSKHGYAKVTGCCHQATKDGYEWIWIDTCCIDKSSSAELSEAINSMYTWYAESDVCYVYLSDVRSVNAEGFRVILRAAESSRTGTDISIPEIDPQLAPEASTNQFLYEFKSSRWLRRGWTLQELIAPRYIEFYNHDWAELGTKATLRAIITEATGIDEGVLLGYTALSDITVALKMSWAANRVTTRQEDMAYCLMGIFNINMPLLYGEGTKAFKRLQEEIIRHYEDYTILLCINTNWDVFLAEGPADFTGQVMHDPELEADSLSKLIRMDLRRVRNQTELPTASSILGGDSYTNMALTSRGVHAALLCLESTDDGFFLAWTRCWYDNDNDPLFIFLRIRRPTGKVAHYRQPHLLYIKQSDMTRINDAGNATWREIYLETRRTSIVPNSHSWTTIDLHFSQHSEITALCHSRLLAVALPTTTNDKRKLIRILDRWTIWNAPLLPFLVVVVLTLPDQATNANYVFLIGKINEYDWCLVFHEATDQVPDNEYLDSVLCVWNLKNIAEPEAAAQLVRNIRIPLSELETLSVSQKVYGVDEIAVQVLIEVKAPLLRRH